jgi:CDP-diacylglycerol--glycerol-3-phosphate 3-phosphatidyltransferase
MPKSSPHGEYKVNLTLREFLYIPNLITLSRLPLVPVIIYFLSHRDSRVYQIVSFGLLSLCFFTDWLDGYLARRLNQVSALGKTIDPIVDKAVVIAFVIALIFYRDFPLWAALIFACKNLILLILGGIAIKLRKTAVSANVWGKINLWLLGIMSGFYVINFPFKTVFLIAGLVTSAIVLVNYSVIFFKIIKGEIQPEA